MSSIPSADAAKPQLGSHRQLPGPARSNARACAARVTASCAARSGCARPAISHESPCHRRTRPDGVSRCAIGADRAVCRVGDPLAGITSSQFEQFRLGLDDFLEVETSEEGLGPAFNGTSCAVCHNVPSVGGGGTIAEIRAAGRDSAGRPVALSRDGETLFQLFSIPTHGCQVIIPPEAVIIARRIPIPLFGAGLVGAIPDATILSLADPDDRDGDGVSGRASAIRDVETGDTRVGRFGWKAQHATLLTFGADAYRNEMGITNDLFRGELGFGVSAEQYRHCDPTPDPEDLIDPSTRRRGIDNFASFMRFLAPVARESQTPAVQEGQRLFSALGCAACHAPSMVTGPSAD